MEFPNWWLYITGIFCGVGIFTWIVLLVLMLRMQIAITDLKTKIDEIAISVKSAAQKVEGTATMVRNKSETMLSVVGEAVLTVATRLTMLSTILGFVVAAAKAKHQLSELADKKKSGKAKSEPS